MTAIFGKPSKANPPPTAPPPPAIKADNVRARTRNRRGDESTILTKAQESEEVTGHITSHNTGLKKRKKTILGS